MSFWFFCNCFDFLFFKKKTLSPDPGGNGEDRSAGYFGARGLPQRKGVSGGKGVQPSLPGAECVGSPWQFATNYSPVTLSRF